jgi:hypothetical protein
MKSLELPSAAETGDVVKGLHAWVSHHDISFQLGRRARITLNRDGVDSEARDDVRRGGSLRGEWTGCEKHDRCCCDPG